MTGERQQPKPTDEAYDEIADVLIREAERMEREQSERGEAEEDEA